MPHRLRVKFQGIYRLVGDAVQFSVGGLSAILSAGSSNVAPFILVQPQPQTVTAPSAATFTVFAGGTAPLTYQWYRNSVAINGATSASYTLTPTAVTDTGASFYCVITNPYGTATTSTVALTVSSAATGVSASFTLVGTGTQTAAPFAIGYAFAEGEATEGNIAVVGANAQVTVKNKWPGGSVKYAIIAGTADVSTTPIQVTVQSGTGSTGTALTTSGLTGMTAVVSTAAFGSASFGNADWSAPFQTWVSGHRMSSWIYRKQIGTDPHLVAWLEVRYYVGGQIEVLPWVENGYVNVASPTSKTTTYTFTLNGTQRYSGLIDLPHHCRTVLLDGAKVSHWAGSDPGVTPRHSADYLMATGLVPAYDAAPSATDASITDQPSTFTPLQRPAMDGNASTSIYSDAMGSPGAHDYIGILPEMDVVYLVAPSGVNLWASVQRNHYSLGRYAIHYRDESTNRPILFASHPTLVLSQASESMVGVAHIGTSEDSTYCPTPSGTVPPPWVETHHPSTGYFAYLLSGRYYFLEETQFAATIHYLRNTSDYRQQAKGIFRMRLGFGTNTTRGVAWQMRTLAQAAAITPDSDTTYRANFVDSLKENINFYKTDSDPYRAVGLGFLQPHSTTAYGTSSANSYGWYAGWQHHYLTAAFGYAKALKLVDSDATASANLNTMFSYLTRSVTGILGGSGATEYLYRDAGAYALAMWSTQTPDFTTGGGAWHANYGAVYTATFSGSAGTDTDGPYAAFGTKVEGGNLRGSFQVPVANSGAEYGIIMQALSYAVKHGETGAADGYRKIANATNWYQFKADMDANPVNALVPSAVPAWRRGQAIGEWREITASSMSLTPPTVTQNIAGLTGLPEANRVNNWNGFAIDTRTNKVWSLGNGGHGDWFGNEVMVLDLNDDAPAWVEWLPSIRYNQAFQNAGRPASARVLAQYCADAGYVDKSRLTGQHSYYNHVIVERHNRLLRCYSGSVSSGAGTGFWTTDSFDISVAQGVNGTDPELTYPDMFPQGSGISHGSATCKNPDTEDIYVFVANAAMRKFTPNSSGVGGTWATVGSAPSFPTYGAQVPMAYDTRRDRILVLSIWNTDPVNNDVIPFTWTASGWTQQTFSGSAAATLQAGKLHIGLVYVPATDAFYARLGRGGGAQVLKIDAGTFEVTSLAVTGGSTIPATNEVGAPTLYENVFTKWLYVPSLRGVMYYPEYSSNVWFLRLH